jgi:hypothetical protein
MFNNTTINASNEDNSTGGLPFFVQVNNRHRTIDFLAKKEECFSLSFYFYLLLL